MIIVRISTTAPAPYGSVPSSSAKTPGSCPTRTTPGRWRTSPPALISCGDARGSPGGNWPTDPATPPAPAAPPTAWRSVPSTKRSPSVRPRASTSHDASSSCATWVMTWIYGSTPGSGSPINTTSPELSKQQRSPTPTTAVHGKPCPSRSAGPLEVDQQLLHGADHSLDRYHDLHVPQRGFAALR